MAIAQPFRILLLVVSVGFWVAALPTFARGIVGPAITSDVLTAGLLSVATVFHTLSLLMLVSMCERAERSWP